MSAKRNEPFDMAAVLLSQTAQAAQPTAVVAGRTATPPPPPPAPAPVAPRAAPVVVLERGGQADGGAGAADPAGAPAVFTDVIGRKAQSVNSKYRKYQQAAEELHELCQEALDAGVDEAAVADVLGAHGLGASWRNRD